MFVILGPSQVLQSHIRALSRGPIPCWNCTPEKPNGEDSFSSVHSTHTISAEQLAIRYCTCRTRHATVRRHIISGSGQGCPLLRASDEHILIVRVLRARRAPGRSPFSLLEDYFPILLRCAVLGAPICVRPTAHSLHLAPPPRSHHGHREKAFLFGARTGR